MALRPQKVADPWPRSLGDFLNRWIVIFTGPVLYSAFTSSEIGKFFLDDTTSLKFTFIAFFEVIYESNKTITTGSDASVNFENGPHAKNSG